MPIGNLTACVLLAAVAPLPAALPVVKLVPRDDHVRFEIGNELFTQYVFRTDSPRPYLHPVCAPGGIKMTRDFPVLDAPGEKRDHPHHRSLWFGHGSVNGHDLWSELPGSGRVIFDRLLEARSGQVGLLRARHRWESSNGRLLCTDEVTIRVRAVPHGRLLDYEITLQALADSPLVFGDTKEGTMAMRAAQWMVTPRQAPAGQGAGPRWFLNSAGDRDGTAWGKRAAWASSFAPLDGRIYGVAIFDHPSNFAHPTWWHTRSYGLFAANPFGRHEFERLSDQPDAGQLVVPPGGSVTLRYRFYIHEGDPSAAQVSAYYHEYASGR